MSSFNTNENNNTNNTNNNTSISTDVSYPILQINDEYKVFDKILRFEFIDGSTMDVSLNLLKFHLLNTSNKDDNEDNQDGKIVYKFDILDDDVINNKNPDDAGNCVLVKKCFKIIIDLMNMSLQYPIPDLENSFYTPFEFEVLENSGIPLEMIHCIYGLIDNNNETDINKMSFIQDNVNNNIIIALFADIISKYNFEYITNLFSLLNGFAIRNISPDVLEKLLQNETFDDEDDDENYDMIDDNNGNTNVSTTNHS